MLFHIVLQQQQQCLEVYPQALLASIWTFANNLLCQECYLYVKNV